MIKFPKELINTINECVDRNKNDVQKTIVEAQQCVRALSCFNDVISLLIDDAVKGLVYDRRSEVNHKQKTESRQYYTQQRINPAASKVVNRTCKSAMDYMLGGRTIRTLTRSDLLSIIESEKTVIKGHRFNVRLCEELLNHVQDGMTVQDAFASNEKKFEEIFDVVNELNEQESVK